MGYSSGRRMPPNVIDRRGGGGGLGQGLGMVGDLQKAIGGIDVSGNLGDVGKAIGGLSSYGQLPGGITGQGFGTLENMLATGAPVDVAPLTEAAKTEAARTFQDLMQGTNEQFGALNLGSSSARQAQLGRQASGLAQAVGETGLRAGVGAEEAARARQMGGLGLFSGLRGQGIGALGQAGQLGLGAGGLNLQSQLGGIGAYQNLLSSQMPLFQQLTGMGALGYGGGYGGGYPMRPGWGMGRTFSRFDEGGMVPSYANGGRVDLGDFISQLIYNQRFRPVPGAPGVPLGAAAQQKDPMAYEKALMLREQLRQMQRRPKDTGLHKGERPGLSDYQLGQIIRTSAQPFGLTTGAFGGVEGDTALGRMANYLGPQAVAALAQQASQTLAQLGSAGLGAFGDINRGVGAQEAASAPYMSAIQAGMNPFQKAKGGMIPGPKLPPDTVPILATGGESILDVKTTKKIKESKSKDPLVKEIKKVVNRKPKEKAALGGSLMGGGAASLGGAPSAKIGSAGSPRSFTSATKTASFGRGGFSAPSPGLLGVPPMGQIGGFGVGPAVNLGGAPMAQVGGAPAVGAPMGMGGPPMTPEGFQVIRSQDPLLNKGGPGVADIIAQGGGKQNFNFGFGYGCGGEVKKMQEGGTLPVEDINKRIQQIVQAIKGGAEIPGLSVDGNALDVNDIQQAFRSQAVFLNYSKKLS